GRYMYFESSSGQNGYKAQLVSPIISIARGQSACLTFWYHMYGEHVSSLTVYRNATSLWTRSGDQGNMWLPARITLNGPINHQDIVFEAVRGRGIRGDIAVDDISYTTGGPCSALARPGATAKPLAAGCDFETKDLCGYTQDHRTDNFDFTRKAGPTRSANTGPSTDHTTGTAAGYYMYMEADNHTPNQKARLMSPAYPGSGTKCLEFWYNMYGRDMGILNVYIKNGNALGGARLSLKGNQGQGWQIAQVTVPRYSRYTIVFEAIRGSGPLGDIAFDDVILKQGACANPGNCNFDKDFCAFTNTQDSDDFDWVRKTGSTASSGTGPSADHTHGNSQGFYAYVEASHPQQSGDRAQLYSQLLAPINNYRCLKFWYNMNGRSMGTLNIGAKLADGRTFTIWSLTGDQGTVWQFARVPMNYRRIAYKIYFEGIVGSAVYGDIAIDDVQISTGNCGFQPAKARPSAATTTTAKTTAAPSGSTTPSQHQDTVSCNFDFDLCSWQQLKDDNFDWTRHRGEHCDHGYYIYTEVSQQAHNATARILSKTIQPRMGVQCLSFWYHMYGDSTGTLNFYIKTGSGLGTKVWTRTGSQGNQWTKAAVTVRQGTTPYAVVLEGIGGNGYRGDMAIDDVLLVDNPCTGGTTPAAGTGPTTTVAPGGVVRKCDFEANTCGYTNDTTDNFNWSYNSKGTSTIGTGPPSDHTYGTISGHYMYIEASNQRVGNKARMLSPTYRDGGAVCLQFFYHMYGSGIGVLNVYAKSPTSSGLPGPIFSRSGNQGNRWVVGQATVPQSLASAGYQVIFEGVRGTTYRADIAIDDISILQGPCASPGACDFDSGLCTWTNTQQGDDFDWTMNGGRTGTSSTGPSSDHTQGNAQGKYVYIETSAPRITGHKAWLVSETFAPGQNDSAIWSLKGNQGQSWQNAQAPIPHVNKDYTIVFEGVRGTSYSGDIAIDDISFTENDCGVNPQTAAPPSTIAPGPTQPTPSSTPNTGPFNCTFESDMCGWKQDHGDQFDWTRYHGTTNSSGTGPTGDHTQANHAGYYVYIETSGQRRNGDKARLVSPDVNAGQYCLTFWYHMYGQNVDHLNVYIMAGNSIPSTPFWTKSRDQGNAWHQALVDLPTVSSTFNVVFEGVRGVSYKGDIGLDDIGLTSGSCAGGIGSPEKDMGGAQVEGVSGTTSAPGLPSVSSCDFEQQTLCGFTQATNDNFDWTRHAGGTSSQRTGPDNDHTYGTPAGHYVYAEASAPRVAGDKAILKSFLIDPTTQPTCVNFWYHMSGTQIGTLNVYLMKNGANQRRLWTLKGNQGSQWQLASVTVPAVTQKWQVAFEAIRGNGIMGDIAIDDFSLSTTGCSTTFNGNCNFDSGLCSWTRDKGGDFDWQLKSGGTSSSSTGPTSDHTHGDASGKYVYIEVSAPRQPGDRALLTSAMFPAGSVSCLHFFYNMYGSTIGTLRVWVRQNSDGRQVPIFELTGRQSTSPQWLQGQAAIPAQTDAFSVVFEGVRGSNVYGDIAIDDVTFDNASCPLMPAQATPKASAVTFRPGAATPVPTVTTTPTTTTQPRPTGSFDCDFSQGLCGWIQDNTDDFDWLRVNNGTPSVGTGPKADHTTGSGYYVYVETSSARYNNKARLLSPYINRGTPTCFTFWYNMFGPHVNQLNIYVKNSSDFGSPSWQLKGTQGPEWHYGRLNLPADTMQVVIEALRGVGAQGDIALDDLKLWDGECPQGLGNIVGLTCDFETSNLCGYTHDTEDFRWTRKNGRTSSSGTGPPADHTLGTSRGMDTELNIIFVDVPFKAGLISTTVPRGPACITFWYHMYGSRMGTLNVYTRIGNNRGTPVWTRKSNQGNRWNMAQVTITPTSDYSLEFEGVLGGGIQSDIAIDDVNATVGGCPLPGECNFDTGSFCSWTNTQAGDNFDWALQQGGTPSAGTGPSSDHTSSSLTGYYAYIESSRPRNRGDRAWLQSESLRRTGRSPRCFSFWYHMYGISVGTFNVYVATNGTRPGNLTWSLSGNQGNLWKQARFTVQSPVDFNLVMEGIVGQGYLGDIAIDDLTLATGRLPGTFNCNFENNFCGWTQAKDDQFDWRRQSRPTSSANTGPSSDHTTGPPRRDGDKARLMSPTQTGTGFKCLIFWYHMYGSQVRTLNIYLTTDANLGQPVWTKNGTQGNRWINATVDINLGNSNQKQYQGIRGSGIRGDIAIDDISLRDGLCSSGGGSNPGTCDFEDPQLCGYTQDTSDKFDWTRQARGTQSSRTGPSSDHTYGTAQGHYMYIETSAPRVRGDNAWLVSPQHAASNDDVCVTFYYHMYGASIGTLNVRLRANTNTGNPEWSMSGNQGNQWQVAQLNLASSKLSQPFQIVFEGIRGNNIYGDIAIDDVTVSTGSCPSSDGGCDFESGLCSWTNSQKDDFDWMLHKGTTASANTGPRTDHTLKTQAGTYIYMESSAPRQQGDTALLVSQTFTPTQSRCVTFWYHMNGAQIGTLNVLVQAGSSNYTIWSLSGDHGDQWTFAQAPVSSNLDFKVVFQGIRGNGPYGDIALDDIGFTNSRCASKGGSSVSGTPATFTTPPTTTITQGQFSCNFDTNLCAWTQDKTDVFDWQRTKGSTPTVGTGPTSDHTSTLTGIAGYYMFIETSSPRHPGDKARLISPQVSGTAHCVKFWYLMWGDHVATLNVYSRTGPSLGNPVFTRSGTQGRNWLSASVDISSNVPFQVVVEGICGPSYRGDIAIDDFTITDGACSAATSDQVSCDFEDAGICKYQQDATDNFDWTRKSGASPTTNSGPTNDHTYGTAQGHYVYIEASAPRVKGDKARLISQAYQPTQASCVEFWYHMYGSGVGSLNVYLETNGNLGSPAWSKQGNQGNHWVRGQIGLNAGTSVQVVFEGIRGDTYHSDIAIDDVALKVGTCGQGPGNCNFELDLCSWTNSHADDFDWQMGSGKTTTSGTGPSADHTYNNGTGKYIFIETSAPRVPGHRAVLQSALFQPGARQCLKFWYHMYGSTIGTLNVWVQPQANVSASNIWSMSGNQGNHWLQATVAVPAESATYQVLLEAIRGRSYTGDIAVDDITFSTTTPCTLQPSGAAPTTVTPPTTTTVTASTPGGFNCDFEQNLCGWTQDTTDSYNWVRLRGKTASGSTGPTSDHTGQNHYYIYMEASLGHSGSTTRLISPTINAAASQCLAFWYHMYGTHVNALNVLLTGSGVDNTTIWTRNHTQGNSWHQAQIHLGGSSYSGYTNVVFEAIRGQSYLGDIAIDDITLNPGSYVTSVSNIDCDFEPANICNYTQETTDDFDWIRNSRSTNSANTGPTNDHTYGTNSGHYVYIEGSQPHRPGQKARLWTPSVVGSGCVSFWYHMYGSGMGTLNVYAASSPNSLGQPIWTLSGNQGNKWFKTQVRLPSQSGVKVVFEGIVGSSYASDIAIDDVKLEPNCPALGACDFENDLCDWTQQSVPSGAGSMARAKPTSQIFSGGIPHPNADHTLGTNNGTYMFFSDMLVLMPRSSHLQLLSPPLAATSVSGVCFHFWYINYGSAFSSLTITLQQGSSSNRTAMWKSNSQQSNSWTEGQVSYYTTGVYQILVDITTLGGRGYIALDDFTFSADMCSAKPDVADLGAAPTPPAGTSATASPAGNTTSQWDCDFEQGLCSYTQNTDDQFDWTRNKGSTGTTGTGPSFDHTQGDDQGYYVYIEASSPRRVNDTARLSSALVNDGRPKCLTFWYHMFGPHVNTLNVYTKVGNTYGSPVWQRIGTVDAQWHSASVTLPNTNAYTIVFEGAASITKCTFEDPGICGFTQATGDNFDWKRMNGRTATAGTGPSNDHTLGTSAGYYMYIEASAPRHRGDKAQLISPSQAASAGSCLRFWYHMYGRYMGTLSVYLRTGGRIVNTIFNVSGDQGNRWIQSEVTVSSLSSWEAVFEGVVGTNYVSDIAIDDVSISPGSCGAAPGNCDFEKDMCTWSNTRGDQFDWLRSTGSTPSQYTGPSTDHTQGNTAGGFVFIESSAPRRTGDKAWLISQPFPAFTGARCFNFWYHMYGSGIGSLNVYVDDTANTTKTLLWSQKDNKGDRWLQGQMPIPPQSKEYLVRVEGIRGSTYYGDIGLDDFSFTTTRCVYKPANATVTTQVTVPPSSSPTPTPFVSNSPYDCAFETNFCSWTQDKTDVFDWTRGQGPTGTVATGPTVDHTTGSRNGWYTFIETSAPRVTNDTARLVSQQIPAGQPYCFKFWYHMYGAHVNLLNVYIRKGNTLGQPVWTKMQSQGNQWRLGQVQVPSLTSPGNLVFEGVRGPSYKGDIGLDDIRATPGNCAVSGGVTCTFENGLCGWTQDTSDNFDWLSHTGKTGSTGTGPSSDHTLGHYMYIETSSPRRPGQKARLISSQVTSTSPQCLSFFYNLNGRQIGALNVYVMTGASLASTDTPVWTKTTNLGDRWVPGQTTVQANSPYKIVIEGVVGSGYLGDLAIDDVTIKNGGCSQAANNDFEHGFGVWTNPNSGDNFDWILGQSSTSSQYTGPSSDHTLGNQTGHYAFIESSAPRQPGHKAWLQSPVMQASSPVCLNFWYNMYGADVGTLNVLVWPTNSSAVNGTVMWSLQDNQGNQWRNGRTTVFSSQPFYITFEAIRGSGYRSDIAIDDITITQSQCAVFPAEAKHVLHITDIHITDSHHNSGYDCNFEQQGFCLWTQDKTDVFDWSRKSGATATQTQGLQLTTPLGNTQGHYAYIETSSPRRPHDTARLLSSNINPSARGACFRFWYHMYGPHINSLNIYVKPTNGANQTKDTSDNFDWTWKAGTTASSSTGPAQITHRALAQGFTCTSKPVPREKEATEHVLSAPRTLRLQDPASASTTTWYQWLLAQAEIQSSSNFSIYFDGIVGMATWPPALSSFLLTLDISAFSLACGCDFEQGLCTWVNIKSGDQFDWLRGKGQTGSQFTGPDFDHTLRTQEWSLHVHRGEPPASGWDMAILQSQVFPPTQIIPCFTFLVPHEGLWHRHAFSRHVHRPSNNASTVLWSLSVDQRDQWYYAPRPLSTAEGKHCGCRALVGSNYMGDLAVDDIVITSSACPSPTIYDCNFESDLCKWQQAHDDKFDWTRTQGPTGTVSTGPTNDHTLGTGSGWYIYIETSSPRHPNDTARLVSPQISDNAARCLSFYYHMYGSSVYLLNVYMKYSGQSGQGSLIWQKQGTQGNQWKRATVNINPSQPYQLIIEGVRGVSYSGDIAVDDVTLPTGSCSRLQPTSAVFSCNFESTVSDPLCGFTQATDDVFDWTRMQGRTQSANTGPFADHTYNTHAGHYVYIESSAPRRVNDTARLVSKVFSNPDGSNFCMKFYYHMYGNGIGTLNVYSVPQNTLPQLPAATWTRSFDQGNQWRLGEASINLASNFQVVFEGIVGKNYNGDIAVDDITITKGGCSGAATCDFQTNFCMWTNVHDGTDKMDWLRLKGRTQTQYTGPSTDHTKQDATGYYAFIESSRPRIQGDNARLASQIFPPSPGMAYCFSFWFHMYGDDIGQLTALVLTNTSNDVLSSEAALWTLTDNNGDQWSPATVNISTMYTAHPFQIVLEGIIGKGYRGDIAIDDTSIVPGECATTPDYAMLSNSLDSLGCTFDDNTICSWHQSVSDQFNWTLSSRATPSQGTGPSTDHSGAGSYIYLEASQPRVTGDMAQLTSPSIPPTQGPACFSFWYHMYGPSIGNLTVLTNIKGRTVTRWSRSGTQANKWQQVQLTVTSTTDFQILMQGTVGGWQGDIALDDFSIASGACPVSDSKLCDFERDICGYTQSTTDTGDWNITTGASHIGPRTDHTTGAAAGHYITVSSSGPPLVRADIMSPTYAATTGECLEFYYHIDGPGPSLSQPTPPVTFGASIGPAAADVSLDDISIMPYACASPGSCDFETDLCAYTNVHGTDQFDWTRGQGRTQSSFTGPTVDHTTGSVQGHYMFIESSRNQPGDKAQLTSELLDPTSSSCLTFYYNMNGAGTGTLNVYMKQQGGSQTKLFSDQGHHGNSWLQATVDLVSNPRFILVFEGVKGANYTSDIAIDDISVQNGACNQQPTATPATTSTLPPAIQQLSCNFDTDLCQWTQDKTTDQFDWTRQHGSTASGNTGPKFDHTQGNIQGYYIYIETSGHNVNDSARLVSPTFSSQGVSCATFWYNMYGSHVNRLSMYLGMASSATTQMWTKSGNQGASWHRAEVELGSVTNGKLVFEALRGNGYMGDIALDDIVVYQGNCPVLCDFEEPTLCGYVQSARDNFDWTRHHGSTASSATGPTNDHTYGTSQGHYMYIESSQPRKIGDKAQFFQQAIQPQPLAAA
ncbi:hypothetical protein BaRGS_00035133, partial [Batillaria attramentaria]